MFQPAPVAPQVPPVGFIFEAAPSSGGPWIVQPVALQRLQSTIDCEYLSLNPDGTTKYPNVDFTEGDCYGVTTTVTGTDTHLRAKAYALIDQVQVTKVSNIWPLPETNVGLSFWLLVFAIMAFVGTDRPTQGR